jgi:hypothetical protein
VSACAIGRVMVREYKKFNLSLSRCHYVGKSLTL